MNPKKPAAPVDEGVLCSPTAESRAEFPELLRVDALNKRTTGGSAKCEQDSVGKACVICPLLLGNIRKIKQVLVMPGVWD